MSRVISIDYETPYGKFNGVDFSVVDLGYFKYSRDPRCVPYMVSVCDGNETWAGHPRDFNFDALAGATLLSHNAAFDQEITLGSLERKLFEFPAEFFGPNGSVLNWHCTANMAAFLWDVRSLADACKHGLGISVDKGVRDRAKGKTWDDMVREGWAEDMLRYARLDAQFCWQLWDKYHTQWPDLEKRLSQWTIDQGRYGVLVDREALESGIALMKRIIFTAEQNLPWTKRGRAPASPIGIAEECKLVGIPLMPVKSHDEEAAAIWEETYAPKFAFVNALKNLRKAKKTLATLETIQLRQREDGRVPFSLKYCAASTKRWGGDAGWNLQNQNKEPFFVDPQFSFVLSKDAQKKYAEEFEQEHCSVHPKQGLREDGGRAYGTLKDGTTFFDMRGLIVAPKGKLLAPVDMSQIEPRVLNRTVNNEDMLAKIRQGFAIYEAHARATMGWTGGEMKIENKKGYALAKARVLGLGYSCGWEKFILVARILAGIDITEGDEQFALEASIDKTIHTRWDTGRTGKLRWAYSEEVAEAYGVPSIGVLSAAIGQSNPDVFAKQQCVFVRVQTRKGPQVKVLPVYGMRSRVTVEEFRKSNPLIVEFWKQMQEALEASIGDDLIITGPNGYRLVYKNIRREIRKKKDEETGEEYEKTVFTGEVGGKRVVLYGGHLVENYVQWVARNAFAERALALHDSDTPGMYVLFTVHDEAVPEVDDPVLPELREELRKRIEKIMGTTPEWLDDQPLLAAEGKLSRRYLK